MGVISLYKKLRYKWICFAEKKSVQLHSLNSTLYIKSDQYYFVPHAPGDTILMFNEASQSVCIILEPMYYQRALDKLILKIYNTKEREVTVDFRSFRGHYSSFTFKKKRKTMSYDDYKKLAYFTKMLIRYSFDEWKYKKFLKMACKLACKERKVREKNGYICDRV